MGSGDKEVADDSEQLEKATPAVLDSTILVGE